MSEPSPADHGTPGSMQSGAAPTESASGGMHPQSSGEQAPGSTIHTLDDPFRAARLEGKRDRKERRAVGRRSRTRTTRKQGRYITSTRVRRVTDLAFDATLREAAPYQRQRREYTPAQPRADEEALREPGTLPAHPTSQSRKPKIILQRDDLRQKVRVRQTRNAVCFVVDASWSMAAEERMRSTKTAILSLLRDAYQRRDRVGLVSFQRDYARVLLPLTNSVDLARKCLQTMPTGGKTPLARGLLTGYEILAQARLQDREVIPLLVLLTDGQANVSMSDLPPQSEAYRVAEFIANDDIRAIVIDTEHPNFERGLARQLAEHLKGLYYRLEDLDEGGLAQMVRMQMRR